MSVRGLMVCVGLWACSAFAQNDEALAAQKVQLEKLRAELADQIQLRAFDLLDELIFSWKNQPPFEVETPVVLADVSTPVGFGTGLQALIENHFFDVAVQNKDTHLVPAYCPQCTALVVHSGAKGTVVARGVDNPEALVAAGLESRAKHALFLDFEIEGAALVLRARITSLEPQLPILYAKTLSTSTSTAPLLRAGESLKSAEQARQEYLDTLTGRGMIHVPLRLGVQSFAADEDQAVRSVPMAWLQSGGELALTQSRGWLASLLVGITYAPQSYVGWSLQARFSRLLGLTSSLTGPDIYAFVGAGVFALYGAGALAFRDQIPTFSDIIDAATPGKEPSTVLGQWHLGVELRVKHRIGASLYLESTPYLDNAPMIGKIIDLGVFSFHSFGLEVSFWF